MPQETLNEREFELVNIIGAKLGSNQRDLSRIMDLSLGMINMLVRRMIAKGYIRINQLSKRKVEYLLTTKGFSEKTRKSVKYTLKTIDSISRIKIRLKDVLKEVVHKDQIKEFIILGKSDFAFIVEMVLRELDTQNYKILHVEEPPSKQNGALLLICREGYDALKGDHVVNVIHELAKDYHFAEFKTEGAGKGAS